MSTLLSEEVAAALGPQQSNSTNANGTESKEEEGKSPEGDSKSEDRSESYKTNSEKKEFEEGSKKGEDDKKTGEKDGEEGKGSKDSKEDIKEYEDKEAKGKEKDSENEEKKDEELDPKALKEANVKLEKDLKAANTRLTKVLGAMETSVRPAPTKKEGTEEGTKTEVKLETVEYFKSPEELVAITDDPTKFNEFLNKFALGIATASVESATQRVLQEVPVIATKIAAEQSSSQLKGYQFWQEHPQLGSVRPYVIAKANELSAVNPSWSLDKVFSETAKVVYEDLGLEREAEKVVEGSGNSGLPRRGTGGGASRTNTEPKLDGIAKEIANTFER